jgi:hypothetical protein
VKTPSLYLLTALAAALALTSCSTDKQPHGKTNSLFNGRDLTGWQPVLDDPAAKADTVWSVSHGMIVCKGEPLGVLQTTESFTNFRLKLQYRWAPGKPPGNSGILTRINGPARALPRCAEVQLQDANAGDVLGLQGMMVDSRQPRSFDIKAHAVAGDIRGVKKLRHGENPAGDWNNVEVVAEGGSYTVWFNGRQVNTATGVEVIAGPIGLQSEGGEIQFRHLSITALPQ